jgi:hypothetical protein
VCPADVLHNVVPGDHDPGAVVLLERAHRTQPRLEAAVVALDAVVGVLPGAMPGRREQLTQHRRVRHRLVSDDLDQDDRRCGDGLMENRRAAVASRRADANTSITCPDWSTGR